MEGKLPFLFFNGKVSPVCPVKNQGEHFLVLNFSIDDVAHSGTVKSLRRLILDRWNNFFIPAEHKEHTEDNCEYDHRWN